MHMKIRAHGLIHFSCLADGEHSVVRSVNESFRLCATFVYVCVCVYQSVLCIAVVATLASASIFNLVFKLCCSMFVSWMIYATRIALRECVFIEAQHIFTLCRWLVARKAFWRRCFCFVHSFDFD